MIPRLHLVTDDRVLARPELTETVGRVVAVGGGRIAVHLRGPSTSGAQLARLAELLAPLCREAGAALLANDRVDVALALGLDGAQLGHRSLPVGDARKILGDHRWLGRSVHGGDEARAAGDERGSGRGADFLLAGTVFPTPSHPGREGGGADLIREVAGALPGVSVIGIGGITSPGVGTVLEAGAHGVAVVRAVWDDPDPPEAVRALLDRIEATENGGAGE